MLILENDVLKAAFEEKSGAVRSLFVKENNCCLIDNELNDVFILEYQQNVYSSEFNNFNAELLENCLKLHWSVSGAEIFASVTLTGNTLNFKCHVENHGESPICSIEYPLVDGIANFGDGVHTVVHSFATGFEVDDPLNHFENDGEGFRYMPYPESFSGSSMQFFGYGENGSSGLYFAAYDNSLKHKWLNFYKYGKKLRASQIAGYEDVGPYKGIDALWDFTVMYVKESGWEEYADIYKQWARQQPWALSAAKRPVDWLRNETGAVTFGINACYDRTKWIKRYRKDIGFSMFHILGPDWPKVDQNFYNSVPGGMADWFPTRFSKENLECIKAQGDKFAPFEFDFLVAVDKADSEEIATALQVWPEKPKSVDKYTFTMLCPTQPYTRKLHKERDLQVMRESGCDAFYYDISANNILKTCMSDLHEHPVGGGAALTLGYKQIYTDIKQAAQEEAGKTIPIGTEMMNETLIGELDYYQARANAQPCSTLETWPFRKLVRVNKARIIPLFAYVYGFAAPLRLDGWGKLTKETGNLIYHTIAKTYLWGGLFEINSEYSELELINGETNPSKEHYFHFDPEGFEYDPDIAKFIGKCAAMRLGQYGKPMIYGEMIRSIPVECRKIERNWFHYNHGQSNVEYHDKGVVELDTVLVQGYLYEDDLTVYIINTSLCNENVTITLPKSMQSGQITIVCDDSATTVESEGVLDLFLAPLEIVIVKQ